MTKHIWCYYGVDVKLQYVYRCVGCGLIASLEVFGDLQDLGNGILCATDPIQLELI